MIGKIKKGSGFKGCVNYVLGKEQAVLLHADGVLTESRGDIIRSFCMQTGMNPDLKKPVGHIAVYHRAPSRPGTPTCAYRVQPHRQQRQDHFGQERYVP